MTRENAIYYLQSSGFSEEQITAIEQAFKQEPCEDAISRQAAIDTLYGMHMDGKSGVFYDLKHLHGSACDFSSTIFDAVGELENLPSVSTEKTETVTEFADRCRECGERYGKLLKKKTGRWEKHSYFKNAYICSVCNTGGNMVYKDFKYCPNCGAKMEVEE